MARIKEADDLSSTEDFQFSTSDSEFEDYTAQMDERKNSYARN